MGRQRWGVARPRCARSRLAARGSGSRLASQVIDDWEAGRTTMLAPGSGPAIHSHVAQGLVRKTSDNNVETIVAPPPATHRKSGIGGGRKGVSNY